jgi:hypothetical protein
MLSHCRKGRLQGPPGALTVTVCMAPHMCISDHGMACSCCNAARSYQKGQSSRWLSLLVANWQVPWHTIVVRHMLHVFLCVCGDVGREVIRLTHFQGQSQGQGPYLLLKPYTHGVPHVDCEGPCAVKWRLPCLVMRDVCAGFWCLCTDTCLNGLAGI